MLSRPRSPPERTRSRMSKNGRASVLPDLMSLMAPSCSTTNRRLTSWGGGARWTGKVKAWATNWGEGAVVPGEAREVVGMGGPVSLRDRLRRVTEVREVEAFGFGALDHPREAVFRVVLVVVRIDGDELDPAVPVVPLDGDHPIFVGLDIRAVVTAEDHHENRCAGEGIQVVGAAVHAREVEGRRTVAKL